MYIAAIFRRLMWQIVVVVYDERLMPDGPDMTAVLGMFQDHGSGQPQKPIHDCCPNDCYWTLLAVSIPKDIAVDILWIND